MDYLAAVQPVFLVLSSIVVNVPSIAAVVALVIAVMLLMASAFVSGSEIAFFSLDTSEMEELDEEENPTDKRLCCCRIPSVCWQRFLLQTIWLTWQLSCC